MPGGGRRKSRRTEDRRLARNRGAHSRGGAGREPCGPRVGACGKDQARVACLLTDDLEGAFLAVVATNSRTLNERVYHEARRRGVLCNVVDVPDLCDFFYPAVVRRGDLQIAVSTAGQSPSLAQKIRQQLEKQFGPGYAAWVADLGDTRKLILASDLDQERKLDLLHSLASREALRSGPG